MRLVILGPPGAGKGTQAERIAESLGIPHISTGELFRANISQGTPVGVEAKKYIDAGNLVPPEITIEMVRERLAEPDAAKGFILDGFPRSTQQAEALEGILADLGTSLDAVPALEVDIDSVVDRMLARGRADDTEEVIRNRMDVYRAETAPVIDFYGDRVTVIDAMGTIDEVQQRILTVLEQG